MSKIPKGGRDSSPHIKTALCQVIAGKPEQFQYQKGQMAYIDSQEWSLLKALFGQWVLNLAEDVPTGKKACYCLPQSAMMPMGCRHQSSPIHTPKMPYQRFLCHECTFCYRCEGPLGLLQVGASFSWDRDLIQNLVKLLWSFPFHVLWHYPECYSQLRLCKRNLRFAPNPNTNLKPCQCLPSGVCGAWEH